MPILSSDSGASPGDDSTVRLITGDIVHLSGGKVTGVTPADRPDGTTPQYAMSNADSSTYVVPSDLASLVGQQLDRELFNVTTLASYNLTGDSALPVIITQTDGVTAPSAGQLATLGVTAGTIQEGQSFQAGQANTAADQGPAPTWALLDDLTSAPGPGSAVSSQTKVWLDKRVHMNEVTPTDDPASTSAGSGSAQSTTPDSTPVRSWVGGEASATPEVPTEQATPSDPTSTTPDTAGTTVTPIPVRPPLVPGDSGTPTDTTTGAMPTAPEDVTATPDESTITPTTADSSATPSTDTSATPDSASAPPWMTFIGADQAHDQGYTGTGVTVAVVDTGIDANHPDLVGQVVAAQDFTGSGSTDDENGHGTFVASEIAGTGAASNGYYAGVAPGAKLINARVLDAYGGGSDSTIMAGMQWAAEQGADIINMSLGDSAILDDGSSPMSQLVNQLSKQYGCLFVTAIGNDSAAQSVSSPSTADEALSVGAVLDDGSLPWFTSSGPRRGDGALKPEIVAPGAHATPDGMGTPPAAGLTGAQAGGDGYVSDGFLGTSMAAPLVAGAAALLKQSDPGLDRTDIRARLMASARPMTYETGVWVEGSGILDIPAALAQTITTSPTQLNFGAQALPYPTSVTQTLTYQNRGDTDVTLTLNADLAAIPIQGLPTPVSEPADEGTQSPSSSVTMTGSATPETPPLATVTPPPGPPLSSGTVTPSASALDASGLNVGTASTQSDASAQTPEQSSWLLPVSDPTSAEPVSLPVIQATTSASTGDQTPDAPPTSVPPDFITLLPSGITLSARSVTVPAGGVASVDVTVDPSAFPSSYPGGYILATAGDTVLRTPVTWENSPQTYTVTVTTTDRDGNPFNPVDGVIMANLDTDEQTLGASASTQTFTVEAGHYAFYARDITTSPLGGVDQTVLLSPAITVGSDTTVVMDGTTAQPFTIATDRPVQGTNVTLFAMARTDGAGVGVFFSGAQDAFGANHLYITPVADDTWTLGIGGNLSGPTVDAALGSCGQSPVTLVQVNTMPTGTYLWTPAEVSSLDMPAAESDQVAAVVSVDSQPGFVTPNSIPEWSTAAKKAGYAALILDSDQPSYLLSLAQNELKGTDLQLPVFVTTSQTGNQLRALGSQGTISVLVREGPAYGYVLLDNWTVGLQPITLDATDAHAASVTVQRRAMGPNDAWTDNISVSVMNQDDPSLAYLGSGGVWQAIPTRTFYINDGVLTMVSQQRGTGSDPSAPSQTLIGPATYLLPGENQLVSVGTQVQSTVLPRYATLLRSTSELTGQVPGLIDGLGQAVTIDQTTPITMNTTLTRLAANSSDTDEQLFSSQVPGDTIDVQNLDPGPQTYRLDQTTTADPAYWSLSTSTSTSWTWQSPSPDDAIVEPLRNVWYELPWLDADNAGSADQPIIMHVGAQLGSDPLTTDQVTLSMSTDDGVTWTDVPLTLTDVTPAGSMGPLDNNETMYTGTISAAVGQTVSLHSFVDGDGSQWDQTVIGAYSVTDTPKPMNPSLSCQAWSNVPDFTQANATHITGTAAPSMQLTILDASGQALTGAVSDDTGHWSAPTPAGTPSQQITLATYYGPTPVPSIWATTTLDTDIPAAPAITSPTDGTATSQTKPAFTGTGTEPGATITVSDSSGADSSTDNGSGVSAGDVSPTGSDPGDTDTQASTTGADPSGSVTPPEDTNTVPPVCTAIVQDDLSWTCTPDTELTQGDHVFSATQTDQAGNVSDPSQPVHLTIRPAMLLPPVITTPIDGTVTNESTPAIEGSGYEPGDHLIVSDYTFDASTGVGTDTILCTTLIQEDLSWTCGYTGPLTDGDHTLTAAETNAAGDSSDPSQPVRLTIRTVTLPSPVITTPTDGTVTSESSPAIAGSASQPGNHVIVSDYTFDASTGIGTTAILCDTTINADLSWTCAYAGPLVNGDHALTAAETTAAGEISDSSYPIHLTVETTTPQSGGNATATPSQTPAPANQTVAPPGLTPATPGPASTSTGDSAAATSGTAPVTSQTKLSTTDTTATTANTGGTTQTAQGPVSMAVVLLAMGMVAAAFAMVAVLRRRTP